MDFEEGAETKELQQAKAKRCAEMAADPNIYENLVASVCPSIWEMDDVKKGVLCQVVSGSNKILPSGKFRGEINILLCGDPGACARARVRLDCLSVARCMSSLVVVFIMFVWCITRSQPRFSARW